MAGHELHVVAERPEPARYGLDKLLVIATRKIRAPDRTCKQNVANERHFRAHMEEHDVAGRVAGTVADAELRLTDLHDVAVLKPTVWRAILGVGEARTCGVAPEPVEQIGIVFVRTFDRHAKLARQPGGAACVVEMAMRQQDLLKRHPFKRDGLANALEVAAGVDDGTPHGARAPHQRAILLIGGDRKYRGLDRGRFHAI